MVKSEATNYTLIFGSNTFIGQPRVIVFEGSGVKQDIIRFRVGGDGKFLIDCKVKDLNDHTIATVSNGKFVHVNEGFEGKSLENGLLLTKKEDGKVYLELQMLGPLQYKINGIFSVNGKIITATDSGLQIGNGITLARNIKIGGESAIVLSDNMFAF